jgi:hypothetical protein
MPAVEASVGEPCRFHDLRHTHAALLIMANTRPKVLQSRLGHISIKTTLDIYEHLCEPLDEEAANRLEEFEVGAIAHETRIRRLTPEPPIRQKPLLHKGFCLVEVRRFEPLTPTLRT